MFLQATSFELGGKGFLIMGEPGVGKTSLCLCYIQKGAFLISDDLTKIILKKEELILQNTGKYIGCLFLRGKGLLKKYPTKNKINLAGIIFLSNQKIIKKNTEYFIEGLKIPIQSFYFQEPNLFLNTKKFLESFILIDF